VASTLLNAGYFLPIVYRAFFREGNSGDADHGEAPWTMVAALVSTAALTLLMFFWADLPLALARSLV
jgi:multicomponent Na+:H+ antiporter subunit D